MLGRLSRDIDRIKILEVMDLGICMHNASKVAGRVEKTVNKAESILGFINISKEGTSILCETLCCFTFELYFDPFWLSHVKNVKAFEGFRKELK